MKKAVILAEDARSLVLTRKEIIAELIKLNIAIDVIVPKDDNCIELVSMGCHIINIKINRRGMNPLQDFILLLNYYRLLKNQNYDFAFSYSIKPNLYGGFIMRLLRIPFYIYITGLGSALNNGGLLKSFICFLYKRVSPYAEGIFYENVQNKNYFVKWKLCLNEQCHVLNGAGINLAKFPMIPYPTQDQSIECLYIGRLMEEKGIIELCEASQKLQKDFPNVTFNFLGDCDKDFKKYLDRYKSVNNLHFLGYQKDVKPYIARASCIVLPSYHEGMANALLEGGALGRPLLASNIPGCKEAVIDGKTGFLFTSKNQDSLYNALKAFLTLDNAKRKEMGENSRKHIEKIFDRRIHVNYISNLVGNLLNK